MRRIFLSHSSDDKDFVRPIFEYFGADRCVYDEATFEAGMPTLKEIFHGLEKSDLFVFFISNASLNSKWVQKELANAEEMLHERSLMQIFPIIIDDNVKYNDSRIPKFLNKGFGQYNLRHIITPSLARQKIDAQVLKLQMIKDPNYLQKNDFFYGRDTEILNFKEKHDKRDSNGRLNNLKCMVISGIDNIGRSSYARHALISAEIIESYYYPIIVSLNKTDTIETFIIQLCEAGLGCYTVNDISTFGNMENKIEILSCLLKRAQEYQEIVLVKDMHCLVTHNGLVSWFEDSLNRIGNKITLIITTNIVLDNIFDSNCVFKINIEEMNKIETAGFLRGYSKVLNIPFSDEDIDFFYNMMTGYPPQIKFCVEYVKENSIGFVRKKNKAIKPIIEYPYATSRKMIDLVIEKGKEVYYKDLLDILARLDITPLRFIEEINKLDNSYTDALDKLLKYSICTYIGASGEFIKINASIGDYIQRNHFEISDSVKEVLNNKIKNFTDNMFNDDYTGSIPFSEFNFLLKEELKKANQIPEQFLYPSVFMQSIIELYNRQNYDTVIEVVRQVKQRGVFDRSEERVKAYIQYYYCMTLARKRSNDFTTELRFFSDIHPDKIKYNFLNGFYYRLNGKYRDAETSYKKVLEIKPLDVKTRREMVIIYGNMQDYDAAFELAKQNYSDYPDNIYHIHAYFLCLMHRMEYYELSSKEKEDINNIVEVVENMHSTDETNFYYQIMALYEAYVQNGVDEAINILNDGLFKCKKSFYLLKTKFDVYRRSDNVDGMSDVLEKMKSEQPHSISSKFAICCCQAYVDAYSGKSIDMILLNLRKAKIFTEEAIQAIRKQVVQIVQRRSEFT